ncbi:DUF4236 domain-containing protein [Aeromonas enteropelogenes]|uniref:DUF4236 domain-containing protein n=1 Tax=Aeromonas enteropelogenes TaxID=29489 RepID=UPI001CC99AE3|nr:DUF4236 domain-containing protein [Aeromonas enteropelogenes]UBH26570.1 DUF4236 domain-containing protein [Aeromonas enteropelogenes]
MGLYLRKSVSVGPFRFNLSKSGVGVSAGVKGLRIGSGPRGNYVHIGMGGLCYRKSLSSNNTSGVNQSRPELDIKPSVDSYPGTHEPLKEIESAAIELMIDSSSKELVDELNKKKQKTRLWPLVSILSIMVLAMAFSQSVPVEGIYGIGTISVLLIAIAYYRDLLGKTVVVMYDIESEFESAIEDMHSAFDSMKGCSSAWHLEAQGQVIDKKYHAGASHLVRRNKIGLSVSNPPYVRTNIQTPTIPVGKQTLYFFPDKVIVFEKNGVGAVSYENLHIQIQEAKFIEDNGVPSDTKVIDHTWKYVNKKGGPDKRFKDNKQIPVVLYEEIHFSSGTGLNERIQLSCTGRAFAFWQAINRVGSAHLV